MGDLWIQVVPRSRRDLDLLTRDIRQKVFREDILGYETVLQRTPDDLSLHDWESNVHHHRRIRRHVDVD